MFKLRFTDSNKETGEVFSIYETSDHGWHDKEHFLKSLSKYPGRDGHRFIKNGYEYNRKDIGVISKVEAV